ncbi:DUF3265 domain-containing protein [Vibrio vulnificus]|nr:DUF3265 domain-containing protein [Vibrio vulnificus]POB23598.1 DUF3265 domain-containing protein [Vibrio vulnificus]
MVGVNHGNQNKRNTYITNCLRVIRNAGHFWHAVSFGGESGLREVGLCGIHPLTQRYV